MQNNKLQKIFFKTFLVTVISIILVAGIGIVAYEVINGLFKDDPTNQKTSSVQSLNIITDVTLGTPTYEMIYDADENDSKIKHIVIGIFNTKVHNLDYITVPVNTQVTISDALYEELKEISPTLPQSVRLVELTDYFNGKEAYEYGELILGDTLGIKISFYTKIASGEFKNYFTENKKTYYKPGKAEFADTLVYSSTFINSFSDVKADTVINFLTDFSNAVQSNLTLSNRTKYSKDFAKVDYNKIYYWHLYGDYSNGGQLFTLNNNMNKKLIKTILGNQSYTVTQDEYTRMQESGNNTTKKMNIQILNGAGIRGLAGRWQTKLAQEGYNVGGVGDYNSDTLTSTKIIVKNKNQGSDLKTYFKAATVEIGDVTDGYDIVIVIGAEDNFE